MCIRDSHPGQRRAPHRPGRDARNRTRPHRRGHQDRAVHQGTALEQRLLPLGTGLLTSPRTLARSAKHSEQEFFCVCADPHSRPVGLADLIRARSTRRPARWPKTNCAARHAGRRSSWLSISSGGGLRAPPVPQIEGDSQQQDQTCLLYTSRCV